MSFGWGPDGAGCAAAAITALWAASLFASSFDGKAGCGAGVTTGGEDSEVAGTVPLCATGEPGAVLLFVFVVSGSLEQPAINAASTNGAT